jgi:deoxyribodipyrimidine photo-lyase
MTVIFLFHRDLRLYDNIPLQEALNFAKENDTQVLPVFIFTPEQVGEKAPVRSLKSIACMIQCLTEIDQELSKHFKSEVCFLYDDNIQGLNHIKKELKSDKIIALYETKDYTPYAIKREKSIESWCKKENIEYKTIDYLYMNAPGSILNKSGKIYQKFTPYYEVSIKNEVSKPESLVKGEFKPKNIVSKISNISLDDMIKKLNLDTEEIKDRLYLGGRDEGVDLMETIPKNYDKIRDIMVNETSGLSVHLQFGSLGIREVYWEVKKSLSGNSREEFIRQLYWRDFYGQIICFFEELYGKDALEYDNNHKLTKEQEKKYEDWYNGKTGVDIVDAAMNQLNTIGYMHNRSRLLTSNYLINDLGIPYRYGERYFAEKLLDYNFSQNFGNWSFQNGKLPFARAPYRRDSPENYKKRFDPEGKYIEEWL